jgi:hypothetical protein
MFLQVFGILFVVYIYELLSCKGSCVNVHVLEVVRLRIPLFYVALSINSHAYLKLLKPFSINFFIC